MKIGEICGGGGEVLPPVGRREIDEGNMNGTYHRKTHVTRGSWCQGLEMVTSYPQPSWVAVKVHERVCLMPPDALEKSDLFEMFSDYFPQEAIVSLNLDTEFQDGSGIAASLAEYNELSTIIFLQEKLRKSVLKYEDAIEITKDAFRKFSGDIKANEFKIYVEERNKLPSQDIGFQDDAYNKTMANEFKIYVEERNKLPRQDIDFQDDAYNKTKRIKIKHEEISSGICEKISGTYNRETQIWCGGLDSQQHMKFYGFSWIAVHGKDSVCAVTLDKVGNGLLEELSHHLEGRDPRFGKDSYCDLSSKMCSTTSPFAVVSVVLDWCDEVDAEHYNRASFAEIEAVGLLAKHMDNVPCFTYEVTVKTAIRAFICLARKDLIMENKKAYIYILRKGNLPVVTWELTIKEIEELLMKEKPLKYLMD